MYQHKYKINHTMYNFINLFATFLHLNNNYVKKPSSNTLILIILKESP